MDTQNQSVDSYCQQYCQYNANQYICTVLITATGLQCPSLLKISLLMLLGLQILRTEPFMNKFLKNFIILPGKMWSVRKTCIETGVIYINGIHKVDIVVLRPGVNKKKGPGEHA